MSNSTSKTMDSDGYRAIESALLASDRGRLFLAEYARRQRASGTVTLLDAIYKLDDVIRDSRASAQLDGNLDEARALIARARGEIAEVLDAIDPGHAVKSMTAERLTRTVYLLDLLDGRLTNLIAFRDGDVEPSENTPAPPPSPSAAASLLRKLKAMTPEQRRALFR